MYLDLTLPFTADPGCYSLETSTLFLPSEWCDYTGVVHQLSSKSMCGTYIDFPGHILECDNGVSAESSPQERFIRQEAIVLHLDRESGSVAVTAEELSAAAGGQPKCGCLVLNALKSGLNPRDIDIRSVWLDRSAVEWIIGTGCHCLVSDIYERKSILGVFKLLFDAGMATVCEPVNLFRLPNRALISAVWVPFPGAKQIPCRLFAEF